MSIYTFQKIMLACGLALSLDCAAAGNPQFNEAAASGNLKQLRALLASGVAVDTAAVDGSTALHTAVENEQLEVVKLLLASGANPNVGNRYQVVPLYLAALNGNIGLLSALLAAGAEPSGSAPSGETLLMTAARTGKAKAMQLLLDAGAKVDARDPEFGQTALMLAARGNNAEAISLLLDRGADINAATRIGATPAFVPPCKGTGCGSEGVGINRGGLPDRGRRDMTKGGMTPLLYAAREGLTAAAAVLIKRGANLEQAEANGIKPLLMALLSNQLALADLLLDSGANVNVDDFWGRTPLWAAVEYRNLDMSSRLEDAPTSNHIDRDAVLPVIKRLLAAGANVNAQTREVPPPRKWLYILNDVSWVDFTGQTAFLRAAFSGDTTVMQLLLQHGADPNLPTSAGTTPLMAASGVGWVVAQTYTESTASLLEAVRICLAHGADVNAVNSMGLSAVLGAANKGGDELIRLLAANGARLNVADVQGRDAYRWAGGVFLAAVGAELKAHTILVLDELNGRAPSRSPGAETPVQR